MDRPVEQIGMKKINRLGDLFFMDFHGFLLIRLIPYQIKGKKPVKGLMRGTFITVSEDR